MGAGAGAGALPPDPVLGVELPESPDFLRLPDVSGVVTPPVTGVVDGWNVGTGVGFESPPLDAIATTTIRKNRAAPRATSLRRR